MGSEVDDKLLRLRPGSMLGRYELVAIVASGGMGRVWAARAKGHQGFRRLVALKTILPSFAANPEFERRFLDEARIAAQIHHPNVCQIDDLGEEDGILYMALEWIDGAPLSELYPERSKNSPPKRPPVDARFAARVMSQVCAGVHAAHELVDEEGVSLGVVHRDVSPQNVLVGEGVVKVTDFGIAKAVGQGHETKAGEVRGKSPYLAPEQLTAQAIDRRTDVYAIGAVLYEMSTGFRAFDGETDAQILMRVMNEAPKPPNEVVTGYPLELQAIVLRALSKRPSQRFASALEMQRALEHFLATREVLTDSAMTAILNDRLGAVLQARREMVKRPSPSSAALKAEPPSGETSSPMLLTADLLSLDSSDVRAGIAQTAASPVQHPAQAASPQKPPPPTNMKATQKEFGAHVPAPPPPPAPNKPSLRPITKKSHGIVPDAAPASRPDPHGDTASVPSDLPPSSMLSSEMPKEALGSPGFLDPAALAAARNSNAGSPPQARTDTGSIDMGSDSGGIQLERMDLMAAAVQLREEYLQTGPTRPKKSAAAPEKKINKWVLIGGAAVAVLLLLYIAGRAALPSYVTMKVNNAAADAGLAVKWGKLAPTARAITLTDVTLAVTDIPGVALTAKQVELLPGYSPSRAELRGITLTIDGPLPEVVERFRAWTTSHPLGGNVTTITLDETHLEWTRVFSDSEVLRADGLHAEITRSGTVAKIVTNTPSLRLEGDKGTFGPWGVDVTADGGGTTMHAALDPSVPQGASVAVSLPNDAPPSVTVHVTRSPLSRLGISPGILGLAPTDETQLELDAQFAGSAPSRLRGDVHLILHDAKTTAMPVPLDVTLTATANGDTRDPLPIHVTELVIGPLRAQAETLLNVADGAFRLDGKWSAQMPCARMADIASDAGFGLGTVSTPLGKLVKSADRKGDASASGLITFDARHLDQIRFAPTFASTCGIPLLTVAAAP